MKVLIVDDERRAREEMERMLGLYPWIKIVGEAATVQEALVQIDRHDPEVLFLDIQMPKKDGFQLVKELPSPSPKIIFTTAYDQFAIRAFEVNALDYLLKPIAPDRLKTALAKLQVQTAGEGTEMPFQENDRVFIRDGDMCWFVSVTAIRLLESEGDYTRIYFDDQNPLIYRTVSSLEQKLPSHLFFRANRKQILNFAFIEAVTPWFSNTLKVTLQGGAEVEISRRSAKAFRKRLTL
jgi:two-component system, LytTR family, response regulator